MVKDQFNSNHDSRLILKVNMAMDVILMVTMAFGPILMNAVVIITVTMITKSFSLVTS